MNEISERLLEAVKNSGCSYGELSRLTGIPKSAIQRYATGDTDKIPVDRLQLLASVLGTSAEWILGWETRSEAPGPAAPPVSREIEPIYDALNSAGREELCRYGRYLTTIEDYKASEAQPQITYIRHYLVPAAAGYASPVEGEDYEDIPLPREAPAGADFCIDIRGDSMEPYIRDGERVFIKRGAELREFEPGIFFVDGDVYCKQWAPGYGGEFYLLSANPKRENANITIYRDGNRNCVYFGKVLLKKRLPRPVYE